MHESTFIKILCAAFFVFSAPVFSEAAFRSESPILGGAEWERHLSLEVHLGIDPQKVGGLSRFVWGPWLSAESHVEQELKARSILAFGISFPFRWALYDAIFFATGPGFEKAALGNSKFIWQWQSQVALDRVRLLFDFKSALNGPSQISMALQSTWNFESFHQVQSFVGVRYENDSQSLKNTFLVVTGTEI